MSFLRSILFLLLSVASVVVKGQFNQVAVRPNNHPLRPYVYPVVAGGVRYFREYSKQQLLRKWGDATSQQRRRFPGRVQRISKPLTTVSASNSFTTKQLMEHLYSERAWTYDASFHPHLAVDFVKWAGLEKGQKVLDLGCGTGLVSIFAKQVVGSEGEVVGIDIVDNMLALARAKAMVEDVSVKFVHHDISNLDTLDLHRNWDVITCASTFILLEDQNEALENWANYLKPGGKLIVDVPTESPMALTYAINDAASSLGYKPYVNGRWIFGPRALAVKLNMVGLSPQVIKSRDYTVARYDLAKGLKILHAMLGGRYGMAVLGEDRYAPDLWALAEANYRTWFAKNMDKEGMITEVTNFYVGIGTKLAGL